MTEDVTVAQVAQVARTAIAAGDVEIRRLTRERDEAVRQRDQARAEVARSNSPAEFQRDATMVTREYLATIERERDKALAYGDQMSGRLQLAEQRLARIAERHANYEGECLWCGDSTPPPANRPFPCPDYQDATGGHSS